MGAALGRLISDYRGLVEVCQQRAVELEISRLEIDRISGLTEGYSAKLLGNGNGKKPKRMWPVALESILGTLGLRILLIEDPDATARTIARRDPVSSSRQRFGNTSNSKSSLSVESTESPLEIAPPQRDEQPPVSRAHLRVVQSKGGRKYG
jgi:hypothetical protein